MLRSIGNKPKNEDRSLTGRLLDCHARIRETLELAQKLAAPPRASDEQIAEAAERVRRYFTRALPMHVRDEEESILPRLARKDEAGALERMRAEHREHDALVAALVKVSRELREAPARWEELRGPLGTATSALREEMLRHLEEEEKEIFPLLASLGADESARILEEMETRRAEGGGGGGRGRSR